MDLDDWQFELPLQRIAQEPATPRESARLWVHRLGDGSNETAKVQDLLRFVGPDDLLVFNDTKVIPARVFAVRESGARIELLFLEPAPQVAHGAWKAMVRPAKKPNPGEELRFAPIRDPQGDLQGGPLGEPRKVRMLERIPDAVGAPSAYWWVRVLHPPEDLAANQAAGQISDQAAGHVGDRAGGEASAESSALVDRDALTERVLERVGQVPLPPYIQREPGGRPEDRSRYQTIFARHSGAVAAPTASLHFGAALMEGLQSAGVPHTFVTLHVGLGTFLPIQAARVDEHVMHSERFEVNAAAVRAVEACRARGGRVIAVGTTSARALEAAAAGGTLQPGQGRTELFIRPGYSFRVVQGLMTNFHLPESTLLLLVGALCGRETLLDIYRQAIDDHWRFYSYGDAMLFLPEP